MRLEIGASIVQVFGLLFLLLALELRDDPGGGAPSPRYIVVFIIQVFQLVMLGWILAETVRSAGMQYVAQVGSMM